MKSFQGIYDAINVDGFKESTLKIIDELINDIENGTTDIPRFNQQEHSGLCKAGPALIGASIIASYAARSLTAGSHAGGRQNAPSSWEIDELIQPYVRCKRLATKEEIDELATEKGFRDNWSGQGVNYISDRLVLEDMHPANVFIDEVSSRAICIDCIVKFVR